MYASLLLSVSPNSLLIKDLAFIPAISPCAAASSYPDVPFICPAKNNPLTFFDSSVDFSCDGRIKSYSTA